MRPRRAMDPGPSRATPVHHGNALHGSVDAARAGGSGRRDGGARAARAVRGARRREGGAPGPSRGDCGIDAHAECDGAGDAVLESGTGAGDPGVGGGETLRGGRERRRRSSRRARRKRVSVDHRGCGARAFVAAAADVPAVPAAAAAATTDRGGVLSEWLWRSACWFWWPRVGDAGKLRGEFRELRGRFRTRCVAFRDVPARIEQRGASPVTLRAVAPDAATQRDWVRGGDAARRGGGGGAVAHASARSRGVSRWGRFLPERRPCLWWRCRGVRGRVWRADAKYAKPCPTQQRGVRGRRRCVRRPRRRPTPGPPVPHPPSSAAGGELRRRRVRHGGLAQEWWVHARKC
mmetsp:Transcript_1111/g.4208  ORF Transcript_1111/g.4208 Transcript_1111/m.4208 type:complete len:348 (+) Transcript_1111:1476-2519(+)